MRDFLDAILAFIESESLTDDEFETITLEEQTYTKETYEALKAVLQSREEVSGQGKKLKLYFIARGVDLSEAGAVKPAASQIFIGDDISE